MIDKLIDKRDNFDLIRDQIAQILADETVNMQNLAVTAGKDPKNWLFKVFTERSAPWDDNHAGDLIVNVWFDNSSVDLKASDPITRQKVDGTFNIDVIGFADSKSNGTGHIPGDELASREAARGITLIRNIIQADIYRYLKMRGIVWNKMARSINMFQPPLNNRHATHVMGARLVLDVSFNEYGPEQTPAQIDYISTTIKRAEDSSVLAQIDYDFTL